jgi:hypothetical protein
VNPVQAGAPHIFSLSGGVQSATVSFTAPSYTGGAPIAGYELVATGTDSSVLTNSACSVSGTPLSRLHAKGRSNYQRRCWHLLCRIADSGDSDFITNLGFEHRGNHAQQ